jgi:hypothetical protein
MRTTRACEQQVLRGDRRAASLARTRGLTARGLSPLAEPGVLLLHHVSTLFGQVKTFYNERGRVPAPVNATSWSQASGRWVCSRQYSSAIRSGSNRPPGATAPPTVTVAT